MALPCRKKPVVWKGSVEDHGGRVVRLDNLVQAAFQQIVPFSMPPAAVLREGKCSTGHPSWRTIPTAVERVKNMGWIAGEARRAIASKRIRCPTPAPLLLTKRTRFARPALATGTIPSPLTECSRRIDPSNTLAPFRKAQRGHLRQPLTSQAVPTPRKRPRSFSCRDAASVSSRELLQPAHASQR